MKKLARKHPFIASMRHLGSDPREQRVGHGKWEREKDPQASMHDGASHSYGNWGRIQPESSGSLMKSVSKQSFGIKEEAFSPSGSHWPKVAWESIPTLLGGAPHSFSWAAWGRKPEVLGADQWRCCHQSLHAPGGGSGGQRGQPWLEGAGWGNMLGTQRGLVQEEVGMDRWEVWPKVYWQVTTWGPETSSLHCLVALPPTMQPSSADKEAIAIKSQELPVWMLLMPTDLFMPLNFTPAIFSWVICVWKKLT